VVDDEVIQTEVLKQVLNECEVDCANDGRLAIELARRNHPDLILLDMQMPGMDGLEVCEALKALPDTREIPIIFLTAETDPSYVARAFKTGAVDYVPKPYEYSEIKERVRTHLELKNNRESLSRQNQLLEKTVHEQEIDINLARDLLTLINSTPPRYIELDRSHDLFIQATSRPCYRQGGDHYLVRTITTPGGEKTLISLKDQSGHKVNCVLRSIATDLYHNSIISHHPQAGPGRQAELLNEALIKSGSFQDDDFFTAINLELDHATLCLRFVSGGHPPMLHIRRGKVRMFPAGSGANLPFCVMAGQDFSEGELPLAPGDRIILFTDGLTSMPTRNDGRALSNKELFELVARIVDTEPTITVSKLIRKTVDAVHVLDGDAFTKNDTDDDISLIGLEIEPSKPQAEVVLAPEGDYEISELIENLIAQMTAFLTTSDFVVNPVNLRMAVNEAVVNAWAHGCGKRPGERIRVRWRLANEFIVEVIDPGPGFDTSRVADPTLAENRARECGRGIFIIRTLASDLSFRDDGRRLIASFADNGAGDLSDNIGTRKRASALWKKDYSYINPEDEKS